MRTAAKIIVAGVSTVALAGGIGAGLAYADPADPTSRPSSTPTASATPSGKASPAKPGKKDKDKKDKKDRKRGGLLATALHGEVTLAGQEHRQAVFQRGPAEKASATSVTVKSADGYTATYAIGSETKVRKNGKAATAADLQAADRILVVAVKEGSTLQALRVKAVD